MVAHVGIRTYISHLKSLLCLKSHSGHLCCSSEMLIPESQSTSSSMDSQGFAISETLIAMDQARVCDGLHFQFLQCIWIVSHSGYLEKKNIGDFFYSKGKLSCLRPQCCSFRNDGCWIKQMAAIWSVYFLWCHFLFVQRAPKSQWASAVMEVGMETFLHIIVGVSFGHRHLYCQTLPTCCSFLMLGFFSCYFY